MKGLSRAKFKAWLESKNPRTKVGTPNDCKICPIAKFLLQTAGEEYEVEMLSLLKRKGDYWADYEEYPLPLWAKKFVGFVDEYGEIENVKSVSASKCLSILKECA